jgi:flagellar hook-associated protein 3 FlgL
MIPNVLADLQQSQLTLNTLLQEVASGRRVNLPSDDPAAAANMVANQIESGNVDQYSQNVGSALSMVQTADSALSSVVSSLTQAISLGTQAANGTTNSTDLQTIATQVQSLLSGVVSLANSSYSGVYLFGGTATTTKPYTADSSSSTGYTYNGNNNTNSVAVGDGIGIQVNVPGSQIFSNSSTNVLGALSSLASAIQSGDKTAISTATTNITTALNYVSQQRVVYANSETQLNAQETWLQQDKVTLVSQQNSLVGIDEATAATELSQAETANNAALAAAAKVLPNSLLNYLSPPTAG